MAVARALKKSSGQRAALRSAIVVAQPRKTLAHAVADRLGLPQSYVAKIERVERSVDVIELLRLTKAMGIDPLPMIRAAWTMVREG